MSRVPIPRNLRPSAPRTLHLRRSETRLSPLSHPLLQTPLQRACPRSDALCRPPHALPLSDRCHPAFVERIQAIKACTFVQGLGFACTPGYEQDAPDGALHCKAGFGAVSADGMIRCRSCANEGCATLPRGLRLTLPEACASTYTRPAPRGSEAQASIR